ncbi:MAG: hypothetical protein DRJ08_02065 [Acidobacteria bacterium]|nr:MAG: hypothetical protein DRJ08_02065 [Acidobacteriota bacterium]
MFSVFPETHLAATSTLPSPQTVPFRSELNTYATGAQKLHQYSHLAILLSLEQPCSAPGPLIRFLFLCAKEVPAYFSSFVASLAK